jgi:hypothetical protein
LEGHLTIVGGEKCDLFWISWGGDEKSARGNSFPSRGARSLRPRAIRARGGKPPHSTKGVTRKARAGPSSSDSDSSGCGTVRAGCRSFFAKRRLIRMTHTPRQIPPSPRAWDCGMTGGDFGRGKAGAVRGRLRRQAAALHKRRHYKGNAER